MHICTKTKDLIVSGTIDLIVSGTIAPYYTCIVSLGAECGTMWFCYCNNIVVTSKIYYQHALFIFADEDDSASRVVINLSALPTAPRSARGADVDLSRVPTVKPFTAFIGNLPFEVSQEDIRKMFKDVKVSSFVISQLSEECMQFFVVIETVVKLYVFQKYKYHGDIQRMQHGIIVGLCAYRSSFNPCTHKSMF